MTTNIAAASFKATGASSPRTLAQHTSDVINVKDFGALGDGSTDDTLSIQNALDTAFGTSGSPHSEANKFLNRPVFFPAGKYVTMSALTLKSVVGGYIFGAGMGDTIVVYSDNTTGVNVLDINGMNNTRIENMSFVAATFITNQASNTTGINLDWDGGDTAVGLNRNLFNNVKVSGAYGMRIAASGNDGGYNTFVNCSAGQANVNLGSSPQACTINSASPAVITLVSHNFLAKTFVKFAGGSLPAGLTAGTTYYVTNDAGLLANSFHVSNTEANALAGTGTINTSSSGSGTVAASSTPTGSFAGIQVIGTSAFGQTFINSDFRGRIRIRIIGGSVAMVLGQDFGGQDGYNGIDTTSCDVSLENTSTCCVQGGRSESFNLFNVTSGGTLIVSGVNQSSTGSGLSRGVRMTSPSIVIMDGTIIDKIIGTGTLYLRACASTASLSVDISGFTGTVAQNI